MTDVAFAKEKLGDPLTLLAGELEQKFGFPIGVSFDGAYVIAHLPMTPPSGKDIEKARNVLDAKGTLAVTTDKAVIAADGVDTATITCTALGADATVKYRVWTGRLGTDEYTTTTTAAVTNGSVALTLAVLDAGTYTVVLQRASGSQTGFVTIEAVNA